jgi:hypothetical protein
MKDKLTEQQRLALRLRMPENRVQAHQIIFAHRHTDVTPAFHEEMIRLWHSKIPNLLFMAFREGAKSTIAEEALILGAVFELFHYGIVLGENEPRAHDRLRAIKHELQTNEALIGFYGNQVGTVWNEGRIELANGVCLQALGRGQTLRGSKHKQWRPDMLLADDIEEKEHVRDPKARRETLSWFIADVMPAVDKIYRVRMLATPLDVEALPMTLRADPKWTTKIYPIEHVDAETGDRVPTWPARYPLDWIDDKKAEFEGKGLATEYMREYMCEAEDLTRKVFQPEMIIVVPKERVWQSTHVFLDPARSIKSTSATTGWVVWSYAGSRITVWDGGASQLMPDQIVSLIFELHETYQPAFIGVEKTGLEEFLMQPLRVEALKRNITLPLIGVDAPKGKYAFIEALQPHMKSGEITFAKELPILRSQFLSYPTGRIDGPNALAYALRMRPGEVVFPAFRDSVHIVESLPARSNEPFILALNASRQYTTAVLLQVLDGGLAIHAAGVREGPPGTELDPLIAAANVTLAQIASQASDLSAVAPASHFADYDTVGLRAAARRIPIELSQGSQPEVGIDAIRALLASTTGRGDPLLRILGRVRWAINGFASGYCYPINAATGAPRAQPADNVYKLLLDGLGAVAGLLRGNPERATRDQPNYAYTSDGRRYISALPAHAAPAPQELKRRT